MILDKLLMESLGKVGQVLLKKSNLSEAPKDIIQMNTFLQTIKKSIEDDEFEGTILGNIFFYFVSCVEVRDRNTTSRTFEDIFSGLFNQKCTDSEQRTNPLPSAEILKLDSLCKDYGWKISTDLSGNKREKSDLNIGEYSISLKTLKGQSFNENDELPTSDDRKQNTELNIGSLSYRSLLIGILSEEDLKNMSKKEENQKEIKSLNDLSDRMGGLGSKPQIDENVIAPILKAKKLEDFKYRLNLFLNYVYEDDIYIVLKSNYRIIFHLIPRKSFIDTLILTLEKNIDRFTEIFYRWENNNLRIHWVKLLEEMQELKLPYYSTSILLTNSVNNTEFKKFQDDLKTQISKYISLYLEDE